MSQYLPKDYVAVSERVDKFHEQYPNGSIETTFNINWEVAQFTAKVTLDVSNPLRVFTGSSFGELKKEKSFEKAETVAVGRALAFAGFETQSWIASKEEIQSHEARSQVVDQAVSETTSNEEDKKWFSPADMDYINEEFKKWHLTSVKQALDRAFANRKVAKKYQTEIRDFYDKKEQEQSDKEDKEIEDDLPF